MATPNHYSFSYYCEDFILEEKVHSFLTATGFLQVEEKKYVYSLDRCMGSVKYELNNNMIFLTVHPYGKRATDNLKFRNLIEPLVRELGQK